MSKITYEEYVETAKQEGFEIEFTEEDFADLSEEQLDEVTKKLARRAIWKVATETNPKKDRSKLMDLAGKKAHPHIAGKPKVPATEEFEVEMAESAAADTLKPNSKHADSRTSMMASVVSVMGGMPKKDLVKWFDQTMSQFGPNKDYGVGDNSAKNKASIAMKAVKEDVAEMFSGEELSEDFKEKASVLFEAAVNARIISETARLEEDYETRLNEEIESVTVELTEKLDVYLDYVAEQWMKENEVAIETSLRNELVDDFIEGLKNVFAEHYIDVPQDKLDVLEALSEKVATLEEKLDEMISENVELKKISQEVEATKVFDSVSEGLALTQVDRFRTLAEGIDFDGDLTAYQKKLNIIKEAYFTEKTASKAATVLTETFEGEVSEEVSTTPEMKRWAQAISRTVKK
jgi:hypothetical protein